MHDPNILDTLLAEHRRRTSQSAVAVRHGHPPPGPRLPWPWSGIALRAERRSRGREWDAALGRLALHAQRCQDARAAATAVRT